MSMRFEGLTVVFLASLCGACSGASSSAPNDGASGGPPVSDAPPTAATPSDPPAVIQPPSAPPAQVPTTTPPACAGMGGTGAHALQILRPLGVDLQPKVGSFELGQGYMTPAVFAGEVNPLQRIRYVVATGAPKVSSYGNTTSGSGMNYFATSVASNDFRAIFPRDGWYVAGTYLNSMNGKDPPRAWADAMAMSAGLSGYRTLVTGAAGRVDAEGRAASLADERQGPDWNRSDVDDFIRSAYYSRYFAYSFQIRFHSDCKRDTFLSIAGGATLAEILPSQDTRGLGRFLVDAGAELWLGVIVLGQAAETQAALDATTCATNDLPACGALLAKLQDRMKNVSGPSLPTSFAATSAGTNDWFVDSLTHAPKGFLLP